MVVIPRDIQGKLLDWRLSSKRKPLLLRGARQVGKTYSVRQLAKDFDHYIEINFLDNNSFSGFFNRGDYDIAQITRQISAYFGKPIIDGQTLLFFDEVQSCPEAIESLRFFYEKRPDLHIIASGSLLEFALTQLPSFGVGRIENLFMYPVNYCEYLLAIGQQQLLDELFRVNLKAGCPELFHRTFLKHYKNFLLVGGLPEAVAEFANSGDLLKTSQLVENLLVNYEDDFKKYASKVPVDRLREVWRSASLQAGKKFIHKHAFLDADSRQVQQTLNLLVMAGIVHKVYHSDGNGPPLGAEVDLKKFKTLPLDSGIYLQLTGLRFAELALLDPADLINKGAFIEVHCGLEMLAYSKPTSRAGLNYWHREAKNSNAEVDYLISVQGKIIPIEVKASTRGAMHSMHQFLKAKNASLGIRVSAQNFGWHNRIMMVPFYALSQIERLVSSLGDL